VRRAKEEDSSCDALGVERQRDRPSRARDEGHGREIDMARVERHRRGVKSWGQTSTSTLLDAAASRVSQAPSKAPNQTAAPNHTEAPTHTETKIDAGVVEDTAEAAAGIGCQNLACIQLHSLGGVDCILV